MIRERAQITSVNLSPFQKARALAGEEAPGRGDWKWRDGVTSEDPKAERGGIQFLSSHILPCDLLDMRPFIISVPVLVFFALLSCAAPLLHVAGGPETTAPFPNELRPLVMAYYPDWASGSLPPEKIDYGRFDWIDFAFALPDQSFALTWDDPVNAPALLDRLVASAHDAGRRVKLSIGGWTGSRYVLFGIGAHLYSTPFIDTSPPPWRQTETEGNLLPASSTPIAVSRSMGSTLTGSTPVSRATLGTPFPHPTRQTFSSFCSICGTFCPLLPRYPPQPKPCHLRVRMAVRSKTCPGSPPSSIGCC